MTPQVSNGKAQQILGGALFAIGTGVLLVRTSSLAFHARNLLRAPALDTAGALGEISLAVFHGLQMVAFDHAILFASARTGGRLLDPVPLSRAEIDEANARTVEVEAYFRDLFERRRRAPGDDLTSQLVQAEQEGSKLSNEELTANIILLFGAGHETTVNLIGNGLLALYRNPDQLQLLRNDPSLIANAIEEFLRFDSSVQLTGRTALTAVTVGGVDVAEGNTVLCLLGAANRDPAVYSDPDRLDITRRNIRPLSFGGGIHFCLGAQLARIEGEIAIATLLRRFPRLVLDDPEHPDWRQTFVLRGLSRLPASW